MAFLLGASATLGFSQSDKKDSEEETVFELSPFEVDGSNDHGYRAENTLSGSRMNMSLDDVAQSVQVLTADFLEDVGAESIDDILLYSLDADQDLQDNKPIGQDEQVGSEIGYSPNGYNNIRGQSASVTVDYMAAGGKVDTYNTSRVEVSQGPNAILFGFGGSGGIINISTQKANTRLESTRLQSAIGSFGKFRNIFNYNKPLIDGVLGFRVISLLDESDGWRAGEWSKQQRNTFVLTYNMFEGTSFNFSYENAHSDASFTVKQGATESYQEWAGLYLSDAYQSRFGDGDWASFHETKANRKFRNANGINAGNNQRRYIYVDNLDFEEAGLPTDAGNLLSYRHNPTSQPLVNRRMFHPDEVDISQFTPFGPDSFRNQNVKNFKASFTQRIMPNMYFDLSLFDSKNSADDQSPDGRGMDIKADIINKWDNIDAASPLHDLTNPFGPTKERFWLYSEASQVRNTSRINNKLVRATLGYKINTERLGTHHFGIAAFDKTWERGATKDIEVIDLYTAREHGVDFSKYAFVPNINSGRNKIYRRHYYEAGPDLEPLNDADISVGDLNAPVSLMVEDAEGNPLEIGSIWVANNASGRRNVITNVEGYTASMVNKFLNGRLTTTFGLRSNTLETQQFQGQRANSAIARDENGEVMRDENGELVLTDPAAAPYIITNNEGEPVPASQTEWYRPTTATATNTYTPTNKTFGAVIRLANWVSLSYNKSDNRSEPNFWHKILPDGRVAPGSIGETQDIGLRFKFFENKLSMRLNYHDSRKRNAPTGAGINNALLKPQRTIWNAFRNTQLTLLDDENMPIITEGDPRYVTEEELEIRRADGVNKTLADVESQGVSLRIIANPTKNWKLALNFSKALDYGRTNLFIEDIPWINSQKQSAFDLYQAYLDAGDGSAEAYRETFAGLENDNNRYFSEDNRIEYLALREMDGDNEESTLAEDYLDSLNPIERAYAFVDQEIYVSKNQIENTKKGVSPLKANLFTNYSFRDGPLKGFSLGGGFTWRDGRVLNRFFNYEDEEGNVTTRARPDVRFGEPSSVTEYVSDEDMRVNLMMAYKTKLGLNIWGKNRGSQNVKFQLNVNNVFESDYYARPLNYLWTGDVRKYQLIAPRTWKLTTTIDF